MLIWPTVALLGFLALNGVVIALGASATARYEFDRNLAQSGGQLALFSDGTAEAERAPESDAVAEPRRKRRKPPPPGCAGSGTVTGRPARRPRPGPVASPPRTRGRPRH